MGEPPKPCLQVRVSADSKTYSGYDEKNSLIHLSPITCGQVPHVLVASWGKLIIQELYV